MSLLFLKFDVLYCKKTSQVLLLTDNSNLQQFMFRIIINYSIYQGGFLSGQNLWW